MSPAMYYVLNSFQSSSRIVQIRIHFRTTLIGWPVISISIVLHAVSLTCCGADRGNIGTISIVLNKSLE